MDDRFLARHGYIVDALRRDLADFLGESVDRLSPRISRRYYIDACFYDFMARHDQDYGAWLEQGEFYLYNSTQWHEMVGLAGLCDSHRRPPANGARCLDFGAGIGTHAMIDAALGWDVTLCEVNQHSRSFARFRFDRHGLPGRFVSSPAGCGTFDQVRVWDVVGHLVDPSTALRQVVEALGTEGELCISFDNDADNDWHLNRALSFPEMLRAHGLEPGPGDHWWRCRERGAKSPPPGRSRGADD